MNTGDRGPKMIKKPQTKLSNTQKMINLDQVSEVKEEKEKQQMNVNSKIQT